MRLHIELPDDLVGAIDRIAGNRGRSRFIREAIHTALRHHRQREILRSSRGSITSRGHEWDDDAARWVRNQRRYDRRKVG